MSRPIPRQYLSVATHHKCIVSTRYVVVKGNRPDKYSVASGVERINTIRDPVNTMSTVLHGNKPGQNPYLVLMIFLLFAQDPLRLHVPWLETIVLCGEDRSELIDSHPH
jgi:hypothetical protein